MIPWWCLVLAYVVGLLQGAYMASESGNENNDKDGEQK